MALFIFCMFGLSAQSPVDWRELKTVDDVCRAYPNRITTFFGTLDLDRKELIKVKHAYEHGKPAAACRHLLDYYKNGETADYLRRALPPSSGQSVAAADTLSQGIFTFYTQRDEVPRLPDGRLDWTFEGPADDIEWAWALNRHIFMRSLLDAYSETGNDRYATALDQYIKDWVVSSLPYPGVKSSTAMWRGLEVSFRVKSWAAVFYGLINSEAFTDATRILLLTSFPEHAHYLRQFHAQGNWLTMELSALARGATAWPEFKKSGEWLEYSRETMTESLLEQIYPDGVQTELTAHYHRVALLNFDLFRKIFQEAGAALPEVYTEKIEQMWNYLAYSLRPSGTNPLNNDSDLRNYQAAISEAADDFDRPDWKYIATNGKEGRAPQRTSVLFPYAGQAVFRSAYDATAHWTFFDIGPWGSGHQHNDKLHLSISAYGRDLLVDGGRFAYRGAFADKFRPYARSSASHNLVLIDGQGQGPGPRETEEALTEDHFKTTDSFDYAWGDFDQFEKIEGQAGHTRAVTYVRDQFWVVVDKIDTDRPREVKTLWHWHPDCQVETGKKGQVGTRNASGNLTIVPVGRKKWKPEQIKGQENPQPQGWYSVEYNKGEPNVASIYTTRVEDGDALVWLLVPSEGEMPKLKAKVLSRTDEGVKMEVKSRTGKWQLFVPYANGVLASCQFTP
ncbi:heparinase [Flavilitoribacter nigricans DSM 23189 = NBRC 102662]|uniref:Heparinase n=1 Tax=Flavilitoribacter nigricans (strain ATCC 23147 / DSM 23189 / NBRC 102662 / NCIMB 1420 / SS-2) TaxID=1122177 RepID=A0A2D0N8B8_FLAN2|nr:heparinase [Flavilitoribacter nigricans DSM 23189 = NBRC 102662]